MISERGLHPYQIEHIKQRDRGQILEEIKRENTLKSKQEQAQRSRQLLRSAEDIFRKFPHETIFDITEKIKGQEITRQVSVYYPPKESKKDFIDNQTGQIIIQNPDGSHQRLTGLVNFIEQTGIGKRSPDKTSIEPNPEVIDYYKNQQLTKLVVY